MNILAVSQYRRHDSSPNKTGKYFESADRIKRGHVQNSPGSSATATLRGHPAAWSCKTHPSQSRAGCAHSSIPCGALWSAIAGIPAASHAARPDPGKVENKRCNKLRRSKTCKTFSRAAIKQADLQTSQDQRQERLVVEERGAALPLLGAIPARHTSASSRCRQMKRGVENCTSFLKNTTLHLRKATRSPSDW